MGPEENGISATGVPLLGIAAYSGTGKTTLLTRLIPILKLQGLRLAVIKYSHHDFEIDQPGKDSYRLQRAGADQTLLASSHKSALVSVYSDDDGPSLFSRLLKQLDTKHLDLVLVEGFRQLPIPKIELHRPAVQRPLLFPGDDHVIAVASDEVIETGSLPLLNLNEAEEVAGFINHWLGGYY